MASRTRARSNILRVGLFAWWMGALTGISGYAYALGLGEIDLNSALNERLRAEILLVDVGDLQPDEIKVSLASAEDFKRVGVERFFYLSDLQFQIGRASCRERVWYYV